MEKLSEKLV